MAHQATSRRRSPSLFCPPYGWGLGSAKSLMYPGLERCMRLLLGGLATWKTASFAGGSAPASLGAVLSSSFGGRAMTNYFCIFALLVY